MCFQSSLLNSILGEMPPHAGTIKVYGKLSYAPQEAWVFSGSVKQNIIFGQPFHMERYKRVLRACALEHDLKQWIYHDETLVGEKGVVLSGTHKKTYVLTSEKYQLIDIYNFQEVKEQELVWPGQYTERPIFIFWMIHYLRLTPMLQDTFSVIV